MTRIESETNLNNQTARNSVNLEKVPEVRSDRENIRENARRQILDMDRSHPLERSQLERLSLVLLQRLGLPEAYQGFAMVAINNAFWVDAFAAVPMTQRLLFLPHCLRNASLCKGKHDEVGLHCVGCGACDLDGLRREAETLGYTVIIAEGTPVVVQLLLSGKASGVLGVACLESLEKAFKPVSSLGIPHLAVPLLTSGCVDTTAEKEQIEEYLHLARSTVTQRTRSFLPLLRASKSLFDPQPLRNLLCDHISTPSSNVVNASPVNVVETLAIDWLRAGGKRFRPFITLTSHAALKWGSETTNPHAKMTDRFSAGVKRVALAIEVLHKASLIHDDLEDDDTYRYGRETLHRQHGIAAAVNIGDYLIGLGYRLILSGRDELGSECVADILSHLTDSHLKLCRGQGGEIARTGLHCLDAQPTEIQQIYALKTAPAFEAALYCGIRTAASHQNVVSVIASALQRYCRFLGVAYQLLNDLKDWDPDKDNKLLPGQDFLAARPTMIGVLLANSLDDARKQKLREVRASDIPDADKLLQVRSLCEHTGVFDKAHILVDEYQKRALAQADSIEPPALAEFMRFLVGAVL